MNRRFTNLLTALVVIVLVLSVQVARVVKREVMDVKKFTDYYEATDAANGGFEVLDSNYITIEKEYTLKVEKVEDSKQPAEKSYSIPTFEIYQVKSGDSLYKIAKKFNQELAVLRANNPQVGSVLKIGDKLNIISGNGIFYKVKKGDSLYKISKKYNVKIDDMMNYNKLNNSSLKVGQSLYIPNPDLKQVVAAAKKRTVNFSMPVKWKGITSPFGRRFHPVLKRYIYHKGVDLRAKYVPLHAAKAGKVTYAGWMSGYGKIIIIKHSGGYETRAAHLNNINVKPGQYVKQGQVIGKTGMTGRVTGPHLHFEIRKNGVPYNPMKYLVK
ncbi:peptidoglycan DD-metalloendopeptidase family protein [Ilyobacter polytropus]|uniref:Peptidase M23 n=1 Tax=Ilyobacter polytropus (strain ATCC 51220 / DSM 2926 / LMG 16218 / CuHBu1) TaxID=572544 RepID=E3HAP5_ILYPC|nr:peptidoglycan DD-metalloendopeptidase family protein [Ilyobacter polytropus]ADO83232.1 Peptidase M23 [Ilyobacter polytropus DSM 2926]